MDGIIIIDKEKNWTSNDIVQKLKGIFHQKVGHTGTLDPLATGVLPILIGNGTKLSKYLINHDKEYIATISLGKKTSTGDLEGDCIEEKEVTSQMMKEETIKEILKSFKGEQLQIPPMYSAIKVKGKKLYEYARQGKKVQVEPRNIKIYNIELISISEENKEITYKVNCSKGTYIRTLSEDIASKMGTVGFMKELRRTKVGDFNINQSITISDIEQDKTLFEKNFITIEKFFSNKEKLILNSADLKLFLNGTKLPKPRENGIYKVYNQSNEFIGFGEIKEKRLKRDIIKNF